MTMDKIDSTPEENFPIPRVENPYTRNKGGVTLTESVVKDIVEEPIQEGQAQDILEPSRSIITKKEFKKFCQKLGIRYNKSLCSEGHTLAILRSLGLMLTVAMDPCLKKNIVINIEDD